MSRIDERVGSATLLIVDPDAASQRSLVELLDAAGYRTIVAGSFAVAAQLLESARPDLLITVVRLGAFNGLHLVLRSRHRDPRIAGIVIDDAPDPVLERESTKVGAAAYLARPVDADQLVRRVAEALARRERRRWTRMTVTVDIPVRIAAATAKLLDISYGGFRVESAAQPLPTLFTLELPGMKLSVKAHHVWSHRTESTRAWSCGAGVAPIDAESTQRWHRFVDTVREQSGSFSPPHGSVLSSFVHLLPRSIAVRVNAAEAVPA